MTRAQRSFRPVAAVIIFTIALYNGGFAVAAGDANAQPTLTPTPVFFQFEAQHKDGVYASGEICPTGEPCYAEGESIAVRLRAMEAIAGNTYTLTITHQFQDANGVVGFTNFRTPTSADGSATDLHITKLIQSGTIPSHIAYSLTFTAQSTHIMVNWVAVIGREAADWNLPTLGMHLVAPDGITPIGNGKLELTTANVVARKLGIALAQDHDTIPMQGITVFTTTLTNDGEQDETGIASITLPAQLQYVDDTASPAPTSISANGRTLQWNGVVVPHGLVSPTIDLTIHARGVALGTGSSQAQWTVTNQDPVIAGIATTVVDAPGTLHIIDHVVGGSATAAAWTTHVQSSGVDVAGSPQVGSEIGTDYSLASGTYDVVVTDGNPNYATTFSSDCVGGVVTLIAGISTTCTITHTITTIATSLVVSATGGTATPADWTYSVRDGATIFGPLSNGQTLSMPASATVSLVPTTQPVDEYTLVTATGSCSVVADAIVLSTGMYDSTCTLTYARTTGTLAAMAFDDRNANGVMESTEPTLAGIPVTVQDGSAAVSDAQGIVTFTGLPTGTYTVSQTVPAGRTATSNALAVTVLASGTPMVYLGSTAPVIAPPPVVTATVPPTQEGVVSGQPVSVNTQPPQRTGSVLGAETTAPADQGAVTTPVVGKVLGVTTDLPSSGASPMDAMVFTSGLLLLAFGALGLFKLSTLQPVVASEPVQPLRTAKAKTRRVSTVRTTTQRTSRKKTLKRTQ